MCLHLYFQILGYFFNFVYVLFWVALRVAFFYFLGTILIVGGDLFVQNQDYNLLCPDGYLGLS